MPRHAAPGGQHSSAPLATPRTQAPATPQTQARPARAAQALAAGEACPFCAVTPGFSDEGATRLHWHDHYRSVGTREYVATAVFAATAFTFEFIIDHARIASWDRPILFDGAVRDALRAGTASGRDATKTVSDVLAVVSIVHPMVDVFGVAWYARRAPRVAWQMFVIDAQAYSLTLALNTVTKRLTARARPWAKGCEEDPALCGSGGAHRSFYSSHAAVTATGAGLICAHHTHLELYQNKLLDAGACATAAIGTALTGALRIASDNHWASDVIVGHAAGFLSGYLLPTLLYYREPRTGPDARLDPPSFAILPRHDGRSLGLELIGSF